MRGPTKNLGPIGLAVFTFIGYKQTDRQTIKHTDKPNLYIDMIKLTLYPPKTRSLEQILDRYLVALCLKSNPVTSM